VQPDGAVYGPQGQLLIATGEEIAEAHAKLLAIKGPEDIPDEMTDGVLFEGSVQQIDSMPSGASLVHFQDIAFLTHGFQEDNFTVVSPSEERGGAVFESGERYRVFAVLIDDRYLTWATGAVKVR